MSAYESQELRLHSYYVPIYKSIVETAKHEEKKNEKFYNF